jgi:hypothetical protein
LLRCGRRFDWRDGVTRRFTARTSSRLAAVCMSRIGRSSRARAGFLPLGVAVDGAFFEIAGAVRRLVRFMEASGIVQGFVRVIPRLF